MIKTTLIALGGQTSSGKSEMAIQLAKHLSDCWIINCDSRQIYKYLNLGTGKVPGEWNMFVYNNQMTHTFLYKEVPHFFIDTIDPVRQYTLADFLSDFSEFCKKQRLPKYLILCGGTGLYIKSIIESYQMTKIKPMHEAAYEKEKNLLETYSLRKLVSICTKLNIYQNFNESDSQNPRRLINAILQHLEKENQWGEAIELPQFEKYHQFAIEMDQTTLQNNIIQRIHDRIKLGMIDEISSLENLSTERMLALGLEYRITHLYLLGQLTYDEYIKKLTIDSINYAQKQLTWLKKQPVQWVCNIQQITQEISPI